MSTIDEAVAALGIFRNVILEGPPGTGKSFSVAEIAAAWPRDLGSDGAGCTANGSGPWAVTFHPSTGYEEFVEGIRYNPSPSDPVDPSSPPRGFELLPGVFRGWVEAAKAAPEKDFLVLLDEINRANASKVLGDLLLGLEATKRLRHDTSCIRTDGVHVTCWGGGATTRLAYSGEILGVPDNLYMLGTMNSSDRSIAPLDSALRRRFAFVRVRPLSGDDLRTRLGSALPTVGTEVIDRSVSALDSLNTALTVALGPDTALGHSYLFELGDAGASSYWIELNAGSVASSSQFQVIQDWATELLRSVAPGASIKASGTSVDLEVIFGGETYEVKLEHPTSKPNTQFSASGIGFKSRMGGGGVTVWTPIGLRRLKLEFVPTGSDHAAVVQSFMNRSPGWRSDDSSGRAYGRIDSALRQGDADERTVWRYSILPQLIDTVTQAYAPDLLIPALRENSLRDAIADDEARADALRALEEFDGFLRGQLQLDILQTGHGLTAGLVVEEWVPAPAATPEPEGDSPEAATSDGSDAEPKS